MQACYVLQKQIVLDFLAQLEVNKNRQSTYNVTVRRFRAIIVVVKTIGITYSEFVFVALVIQRAMRMRRIVICGLPSSKYFSTLSYKQQNFRKNKLLFNIKCVL